MTGWLLVFYISNSAGLQFLEFETKANCEIFRQELINKYFVSKNSAACVEKLR